jgi:alkanesulfonate monooxygenase SsuD/methylene tetrahydromethanopterin reductase-like flavin-dependent oxidoreductase (luciferase family)
VGAVAGDQPAARRLARVVAGDLPHADGPLCPALLRERFGMAAGADAIVAAADGGTPADLPAAAEALAREVTLLGTHDEVGGLVAAWGAAGADAVQLVLPPCSPQDELLAVVEAAARAAASTGTPA